jgi:hypothetical protein
MSEAFSEELAPTRSESTCARYVHGGFFHRIA